MGDAQISLQELYSKINSLTERLIYHYNAGSILRARIQARALIAFIDQGKLLGYDMSQIEQDIDNRLKSNYESYKSARGYYDGNRIIVPDKSPEDTLLDNFRVRVEE